MPVLPLIGVGQAHSAWTDVGASDWLFRQLRFGIQLPWRRMPPRSALITSYNLIPADQEFACGEVRRWMMACFCRDASDANISAIHRIGRFSPVFDNTTAAKQRLAIELHGGERMHG
jgi:hypothetical protein